MNKKDIELFSDKTHECWSNWMKYLFSKCERRQDGTLVIPKWAVSRWLRQMNTGYEDLSEAEKEADREVVREYYEELIDQHHDFEGM